MNKLMMLSLPTKLTILGLVLAAVGISTLFLTNSVNVPAVAFGPIILVAVAVLVALGPWRWTPVVGAVVGLGILTGAFIAPGLFDRLGNPGQLGGFVGTWVQIVGLILAVVSGVMAAMQNYSSGAEVVKR